MSAPDRISAQDYRALIAGEAADPAVEALGKLRSDRMNGTERRYADHLDGLKQAGEVLWWAFESITFRLADDCRYTPDFLVLLSDGRLEAHETKGHWRDDARVKIRVAADRFPIRFIALKALPKREGGGWAREPF